MLHDMIVQILLVLIPSAITWAVTHYYHTRQYPIALKIVFGGRITLNVGMVIGAPKLAGLPNAHLYVARFSPEPLIMMASISF